MGKSRLQISCFAIALYFFLLFSILLTMPEVGSLPQNIIRFTINFLVRYVLAGVVIYSCWVAIEHYNYWFSWHVILCTLGYLPLMAEGFMLFGTDELWTRQLTRTQKYWIHGSILTVATILVTAGCIDTFHFIQPGYHLYTSHGITGLVSMIFILLGVVTGFLANYSNRLRQLMSPVKFKLLHNTIGLMGYIIGIISLCFAYYTEWFKYYTSAESRMCALIATIIYSLWTINTALVSAYEQLRTILSAH